MFIRVSFFKTLFYFFFRFLFKKFGNQKGLQRSFSNACQSKYHKYTALSRRPDLSNKTLVFNLEAALLKSTSMFPYFMLVAFEAGSILRAFVLLLLYPFTLVVSEEMKLKIMVMVSFLGIKKDSLRVGRAVLVKFFLEDVGLEAYEVVKTGGKKVAVSDLPNVMIESFLKDYLGIDCVVGRELKVVGGYFVGLLEERKKDMIVLEETLEEEGAIGRPLIGIARFNRSFGHHQLVSHCQEIYWVRRTDKRSWGHLPKSQYPKPLIFHDGRLALRPTPSATLALFMWVPFAFIFSVLRIFIALTIPYDFSIPILSFSGLHLIKRVPQETPTSSPSRNDQPMTKPKGLLYVCNHRTLLDPLYISFAMKRNFTAVTYSLSRLSEILAPIKTVRLTRDRDEDAKMMDKLLRQGDLVVCPEGTTCREPYLLRFSPLFAEMSDDIVPVAVNTHVSMFYGTTAGGLKCLDPFFFLMNPKPIYSVRTLEPVPGLAKCGGTEKSRFDVANHVQTVISKVLDFQCTKLTRRDKYLILAGNEGIASTNKKSEHPCPKV